MTLSRWTPERDKLLLRLVAEGREFWAIGERLGISSERVGRRLTELKRERETVPSRTDRTAVRLHPLDRRA